MKKDNKAIVITSIISGVILIVALVALGTFSSLVPYSKDSVTVEGIAEIKASPDLMTVYFNIETTGNTSSEATDANNEIFEKLITELALKGFDRSDLETQSFNVNKYYEKIDGNRKESGYKANHYLRIELSSEDFDKISEVIDAGVEAGAGINYINFELSQELQNQYKAEALELASQDAQIKADAVAAGFGKKAGKLISVQVSGFGYYPWNVYSSGAVGSSSYEEEAALAKEVTANITPSSQEITARVSATFKIR